MANAIVCKWNGEWHVNKYQINKRDARQRCCVRVVFLWYASEVSANAHPCDGRAERENRIAMNLIPVVRFVSFRWRVETFEWFMSLRCAGVIVSLRTICLSLPSSGDGWCIYLCQPASQPTSNDGNSNVCSLLFYQSRSKFSSFIHWYHNHKQQQQQQQWAANMHKAFPEWKLSL